MKNRNRASRAERGLQVAGYWKIQSMMGNQNIPHRIQREKERASVPPRAVLSHSPEMNRMIGWSLFKKHLPRG